MLAKTLFLLATAAISAATPLRRQGSSCSAKATTTATPTLPSTGGATELSAPPSNVTVSKIVLGHGIQNYTCVMATPTGTATAATLSASAGGALAVLYDVTDLYPGTSARSLASVEQFSQIGVPVVETMELPLNIDTAAATNLSFPATSDPFPPAKDLQLNAGMTLKHLGHHYFNAAGVPTFDLKDSTGLLAVLKKDASVAAPADADKGPSGTGAVAWLLLEDNGSSQGVKYVYRVNTAGGVNLACGKEGDTSSVPYTAIYWFFVPK